MNTLTSQQKILIMREMDSRMALSFTMAISFFEKNLADVSEEKKKEFAKIISEMKDEARRLQMSVKDGYTPQKFIDYFTKEEQKQFLALSTPKKGVDYLVKEDTDEMIRIASDIVYKKLEKKASETQLVAGVDFPTHEQMHAFMIEQMVKNHKRENDIDKIVEEINTKDEVVDMKVVKGLIKTIEILKNEIRKKGGGGSGGGGGMGKIEHETKNVSSATTSVTTNYKIAGNGTMVWLRYQGQMQAHTNHYTVNSDGKTIPLLFTPDDNTVIEISYIRT